VNSPQYERVPLLSADGLTLLVTVMGRGGKSDGEVAVFTRKTRHDPFGNETLLPAPVNSAHYDIANWLSADGRVLLATQMGMRLVETRLYVRPRLDAPFGPGQLLGGPFTAANPGRPWLSPDGQRMYFHSRDFPGGHGDLDLWMSRRVPRPKTLSKFTNGLGMEFTLVPKGKAWVPGSGGDKEVDFKNDFFLGVYEVTQEEWQKVMGKNPSHFARTGDGHELVKDLPDQDLKHFPVDNVSWQDCQEFIKRLNEKLKENSWEYRLPKEVEWEYACRGGPLPRKEDYNFNYYLDGPTNKLAPEKANFKEAGLERPVKVGSYPPNPLGLHDMHGNLWEWCDDIVEEGKKVQKRPLRGGSYSRDAEDCRAMSRYVDLPGGRGVSFGLRLARVPAGNPQAATKPER
jgi:formylglycine-generating enzyme required for sulfatase activity